MEQTIMNQRQISAWAGMIGTTLFVLIFTLEGWYRPGYKPLEMFVSALSLGSRGWIQILNFIIFGALLFVFSRGVAAEFPNGKASRGGLIILTTIAICYFLSGPFVMDPANTPRNQMTFHGTMHGLFGGIVFTLMPISCFVFLRRFREDPKWQFLQWWTLGLGLISALGVVLLTIATKSPDTQNVFSDWFGLIQRTAIVPFMIWIFIFALGLLKRSKMN
jgi:Protein of unknown function (DUF998)